MATTSKNLKTAVDAEVKEAVKEAKTGNVATAKEPADTAPKVYAYPGRRNRG